MSGHFTFLRHLLIGVLLAGQVQAGDDVDYSAPYLTLENGELVTKYPAREHSPGEQASPVSRDQGRPLETWHRVLLAVVLAGITLVAVRFSSRRKHRGGNRIGD